MPGKGATVEHKNPQETVNPSEKEMEQIKKKQIEQEELLEILGKPSPEKETPKPTEWNPNLPKEFPEDLPENLPEKEGEEENVKIEPLKYIGNASSGKDKDRKQLVYKVAVNEYDVKPTLSLQGLGGHKAIIKIIKWMKDHMEAYPETDKGFFVEFLGNEIEKYEVVPCDKGDGDIDIKGKDYKILTIRKDKETYGENDIKKDDDKNRKELNYKEDKNSKRLYKDKKTYGENNIKIDDDKNSK